MNINKDNIQSMVEQSYDKVYKQYLCLEKKKEWPRLKWLHKVLKMLNPGSSVLDLGCGSGDPVDIEILKNHKIIGVDISKNMIHLAQKNVPTGRFIHNDVSKQSFLPDSFHAVVAFYTLEHIPREEHTSLLQRIYTWLRPEGLLLFTIESQAYNNETGNWLGEPMFFSCYDPVTMKKIVREAGFTILETDIEPQIEGDTEVSYLWILARKK